MTRHEILVDARNRLEKYGWTQGRFIDKKTGSYCLVGAIFGGYRSDQRIHVIRFLASYVYIYHPEQVDKYNSYTCEQIIVDWNDSSVRRKEEVLELLDKAIKDTAPEPEDIQLDTAAEEKELIHA